MNYILYGEMMDYVEKKQLWDTVLTQLQGEMTQSMFNGVLARSRVIDADNGNLVVSVPNTTALEWLDVRLRKNVERAVEAVSGKSTVTVSFKLSDNQSEVDDVVDLENVVNEGESVAVPLAGSIDFGKLDYKKLFFLKTGYLPISHYHTTFWQAYLSLVNKQAFSVWQVLQKYDKRNIFKDTPVSWWTAPRKISLSELAGTVGGARTTLTGRLVACLAYEQSKAAGEPLTECCMRHSPTRWSDGDVGERQCRHWRKGALEVLQDEGILLVEESAGVRRGKRFRFQVWRMLPLLTPLQVERLPMILRLRHEQWINQYGHIAGFDMEVWDSIDVERLVSTMQGYVDGRRIENNYHPNPFDFP